MTPEIAFSILEKDPNHKDRESLEHTICSDAKWSCNYARFRRTIYSYERNASLPWYKWPGCYKVVWYTEIGDSGFCGARFELGEAAISKKEVYANFYANDLVRGNWTPELAVMCPIWLYLYAKDVIKGRLPTGMHNKMLVFGMIDSSDKYVKKYLAKKLKHDSRNSV